MADRPYETRMVTATIELRDDDQADDGAPILTGYASTFNQPYRVGYFNEQIHPDAFVKSLRRDDSGRPTADVRLLVDHEGQPLARTKSGTLDLTTDHKGLAVRAKLDPTDPDVQRLLPKMRRGDMDQMSFAFRVPSGGDQWDYSGDTPLRTVREAALSGGDVSVVTYPANENASASVRAVNDREAAYTLADSMLREMRTGHQFDDVNGERLHTALVALGFSFQQHRDASKIIEDIAAQATHDTADPADDAEKNAAMSTSETNDLPDSDFAYIEPGGTQDSDGKTAPRSLRHFPIHDAAHVRNALARAPQSEFGPKAMPAIKKAAEKFGIDVAETNSFHGTPVDLAQRRLEALALRSQRA